jgi:hypothetical protein
MRFILTVICSMFFVFQAFQTLGFSAVIIVPDNYSTIQAAINAANNYDEVVVKTGTYYENIDFQGKKITVRSDFDLDPGTYDIIPEFTVIDGGYIGTVVMFKNGEDENSVLEGFTLRNGQAQAVTYGAGGGIYCSGSSPTIKNNIIVNNEADNGAGIYSSFGSPTVTHCKIIDNDAANGGGGIYCGSNAAAISNNIIIGNFADAGGGLYFTGKGLTGPPVVTNNMIAWNRGNLYGGGIYCFSTDLTATNNSISENTGDDGGGGVFINFNCNVDIYNTILWKNYSKIGPEIALLNNSILNIGYSDVKGGQANVYVQSATLNWGAGNIDQDPLFIDKFNNDFHIPYNSPCKNSGTNAASQLPDKDFETDPRIADNTADIGADEFHRHLYYTGQATPNGTINIKFVGTPGTTPVWLFVGSGFLDIPQTTQYGDWYLVFPLILQIDQGTIPSPGGVSAMSTTLPANTPTPWPIPIQSLIGNKLTNLCIVPVK